tara:strand:+ start:33 stop:521 length:489 start_codon:yes stop_codon:yes gene_type:complete
MAIFTPKQFIKQIDSIANNFMTAMKDELMDMGIAAEKHFDKSFDNEGFTDKVLQKWVPLSRRRLNEKTAGNKILTDRGELRGSKTLSYGSTGTLTATISYGGGGGSIASSARNNHGFINGEGYSVPKRQFIGKSFILNLRLLRMLDERIRTVFDTNYTVGRG